MKKIFLIAVVLLMMINFIINYHHEITKESKRLRVYTLHN